MFVLYKLKKEEKDLKILSIDTSSTLCSVAVLDDENLIYIENMETENSHSNNLLTIIDTVLKHCKITLNDIGLIATNVGPGSFTGIRIGIATAISFCDVLHMDCSPSSSLEALAYISNLHNTYICPVIEEKNNSCFFAVYMLNANNLLVTVVPPQIGDIRHFKDYLKDYENIKYIQNQKHTAYHTGLASYYKYINGITQTIEPLYLKRPQAEIQLEEKLNGN